jgi:hypothetical protein
MAKEHIPLSVKINEATKRLKDAGYVVISNNDDSFAILAERKRILCKNHNEFLNFSIELTQKTNQS